MHYYTVTAPPLDLELKEVINAVYEVRAKWRRIGIQLNLTPGTLDAIEIEHSLVSDRFEKVLSDWLRAGSASWENLVIALWSTPVGEIKLAKQLGQKHCPQGCSMHTCNNTRINSYFILYLGV